MERMGEEPKAGALLISLMENENLEDQPPKWHREYLVDRQEALANGDDYFITLDELEADLHTEFDQGPSRRIPISLS